MKRILVAGGGIAGLSAAVFLSQKNNSVEIFEASSMPGGRARSFYDNHFGREIDNGQHLLMGCYRETLRFFQMIGANEGYYKQEQMSIPFVSERGYIKHLKSRTSPYPLNLLHAILDFGQLTLTERFRVGKLIASLWFLDLSKKKDIPVLKWLRNNNSGENELETLWKPLVVSTMNTPIESASFVIFANVLKEIFLKGSEGSKPVITRKGLSSLYVTSAIQYLKERSGKINFSEAVKGVVFQGDKITLIKTTKRELTPSDEVVFAIPPHALKRIEGIPERLPGGTLDFNYSTIITVFLKITNNPLKEELYSLVKSGIHWVFNHGDMLSAVISCADDWASLDSGKIIRRTKNEISKYLGVKEEEFTNAKVIKEKRATILSGVERGPKISLLNIAENAYIIGDWTIPNLPATIETGVLSARRLSNILL